MLIHSWIYSLLGISLMSGMSVHGATKVDYYRLYDFLFPTPNTYKKEVRPIENDTSPLYVYLELSIMSLVEVAEKDQKLVTNARLMLDWEDNYLAWDPSSYGGIQSIMIPQKNLWLPDIVLSNGVSAHTKIGYDDLPVRLTELGAVSWQPSVLLSTSCSIEITYFPFDTQKCLIEFETALSRLSEVDINIDKENPITLTSYSQDGQWSLLKTSATNLENEDGKTKIQYTITLARRRTFYLITIILPIFFLSMMSSLIFALPPDEGEKMGTGITVVLAFAVYLTIVADLVPNTSLQVSILGVYLTLLLGVSAFSLIVCVFILRVHFRDESRIIGKKTRKLVPILRKITFMKTNSASRNVVNPIEDECQSNNMMDNSKKDKAAGMTGPYHLKHPTGDLEDEPMTWPYVAATYDWVCYILFTFITVITTIVCLLVLEIGSSANSP